VHRENLLIFVGNAAARRYFDAYSQGLAQDLLRLLRCAKMFAYSKFGSKSKKNVDNPDAYGDVCRVRGGQE
jgi:hypothetical protein